MKRKVIISDISAIMPFGCCADEIVDNLIIKKNIKLKPFNLISNFNFYSHGYKTRTRIDRSAELCIHTTHQIAKKISVPNYRVGLITVSKNGCSCSKESYFKQLMELKEKQFASPKDFVQSICNIPNSLATIECDIKGFSNHFTGNAGASLTALWQAYKCVADGISDEIIMTSFDVLSEEQKNQINKGNIYLSEAAASLRIQAMNDTADYFFEILGFGFSSDSKLKTAIQTAISNAIKVSNISKNDISLILPNFCNEFLENYQKHITNMFKNEIPIFIAKQYIGNCFSTLPSLEICILNKIAKNNLSINFTKKIKNDLQNLFIINGSIVLIVGNNYEGNVVATCLKFTNKS